MKNNAFIMAMVLAAFGANGAEPAACNEKKCDEGKKCPPCCCPACPEETLNIESVTLLAANGDPVAQFTLAWLTENGVNTPKDAEKAKGMYAASIPGLEKAAAEANPAACRALAHLDAEGKGVPKNPELAEKYAAAAKACAEKAAEKPAADVKPAEPAPKADAAPAEK